MFFFRPCEHYINYGLFEPIIRVILAGGIQATGQDVTTRSIKHIDLIGPHSFNNDLIVRSRNDEYT